MDAFEGLLISHAGPGTPQIFEIIRKDGHRGKWVLVEVLA
jgi:hypothetical protein